MIQLFSDFILLIQLVNKMNKDILVKIMQVTKTVKSGCEVCSLQAS